MLISCLIFFPAIVCYLVLRRSEASDCLQSINPHFLRYFYAFQHGLARVGIGAVFFDASANEVTPKATNPKQTGGKYAVPTPVLYEWFGYIREKQVALPAFLTHLFGFEIKGFGKPDNGHIKREANDIPVLCISDTMFSNGVSDVSFPYSFNARDPQKSYLKLRRYKVKSNDPHHEFCLKALRFPLPTYLLGWYPYTHPGSTS